MNADIDPFDSAPATKRQRLSAHSHRSTPHPPYGPFRGSGGRGSRRPAEPNTATAAPAAAADDDNGAATLSDISSDTEGSGPASPAFAQGYVQEEDGAEPVSACRWERCGAGDLGHTDALVAHIHAEHVGGRARRIACQWLGCPRKDVSHASAYALRAHMRSHTKEKPFGCPVPECDKAFTRSDALAKHVTSIHKIDPPAARAAVAAAAVPPARPGQRLKLILKDKAATATPSSPTVAGGGGGADSDADGAATLPADTPRTSVSPPSPTAGTPAAATLAATTNGTAAAAAAFPADCDFTPAEQALPVAELFRLCRRQAAWAEAARASLRVECAALEEERRREWRAKELVLANVLEALAAEAEGGGDGDGGGGGGGAVDTAPEEVREKVKSVVKGLLPEKPLPVRGGEPWFRQRSGAD